MTVKRAFGVALGTALVSVTLFAQQSSTTVDEAQVLATDDRRTDALRRGDASPLQQIYADDYTLVAGTGQLRSKADQIAELTSGELTFGSIDVTERTVRVYGDVAVVLSRQRSVIAQAGQPVRAADERTTRVYKKFGSEWRVIATQATPIVSLTN